MLFLSPEPLLRSKGELQIETLQGKALSWEHLNESFILGSRHVESVFTTLINLAVYK